MFTKKHKPITKNYIMLRNTFLLILIAFSSIQLDAQNILTSNREIGYNSQYYFQPTLINPAFAGQNDYMNLSVSHPFRSVNNRNPQFYNVLLQNSFGGDFEGGYGLSFVYQNSNFDVAKDKFYLVNGIVSGGFDFGENWIGKAGLTVGLLHYTNTYKSDLDKGTQGAAFFKINLDAGILLTNNNFSLGFSVVQSSEPEFTFTNDLTLEEDAQVNNDIRESNRFIRAVYLQAMYDINVSDELLKITPILLLSSRERTTFNNFTPTNNNNTLRFELGSNFMFKDMILAGAHVSFLNSNHSVSLMLGTKLAQKYQLAISYDIPSSDVNNYSNLELSLGMFFNN